MQWCTRRPPFQWIAEKCPCGLPFPYEKLEVKVAKKHSSILYINFLAIVCLHNYSTLRVHRLQGFTCQCHLPSRINHFNTYGVWVTNLPRESKGSGPPNSCCRGETIRMTQNSTEEGQERPVLNFRLGLVLDPPAGVAVLRSRRHRVKT